MLKMTLPTVSHNFREKSRVFRLLGGIEMAEGLTTSESYLPPPPHPLGLKRVKNWPAEETIEFLTNI